MKKWEYKVHYFQGSLNEEELNSIGFHGWELIRVDTIKAIFKREKQIQQLEKEMD
jgi:hypothetical protein